MPGSRGVRVYCLGVVFRVSGTVGFGLRVYGVRVARARIRVERLKRARD